MPGNKKCKFFMSRSSHSSDTRLNCNSLASSVTTSSVTSDDLCNHHQLTLPGLIPGAPACMVMPKHIALPRMNSSDGPLLFETILFVYTVLALCLQYLNLYRTVWWLPHSHNRYAVNFYLIDVYLACFIIVLLGRRFIWRWVNVLLVTVAWTSLSEYRLSCLRWTVHTATLLSLVTLIYKLTWNHPLVNTFYLLYPISVYVVLFGSDVHAFFELLPAPDRTNNKPGMTTAIVGTEDVKHVCSMVADSVRREVDSLKTDFNDRLKRVLFNSLLCAYYVGFVPCCFVQSVLYYDTTWVTRQLVILWVGCFCMYVVHMYPPQYCNVLHCAALHLGRWHKVEGPAAHMPHTSWSESILWQFGALVKHKKELFRAEGITNAAEPGNVTHSRFHAFFRNPAVLLCGLVGLQFTLLLSQLLLLAISTEWNHIVSVCLLIAANYYTLFKLTRDYLVLWKIYKTEDALQHKMST